MITDTYKLKGEKDYPGIFLKAAKLIQEFGRDIFGLSMNFTASDLTQEECKLLEERKQARAQKDFKRSDELRDALKAYGIIVEDNSGGQKWRRV
ncbi:MAG: hypothetical protein NT079_01065 [Candidatus Omnitrophica bacterium]|nr:hypothetical protein [Candidatus Omnitrophota bacterium]